MAAAAILDFVGSEIWRQGQSRLTDIYFRTKIGEYILKGGRVMTINVFLKWRLAAILDFQRSEIWTYFCFRDVGFSLWAKFCVNMCNSDWVMAIKVNIQNGGRRRHATMLGTLNLGGTGISPQDKSTPGQKSPRPKVPGQKTPGKKSPRAKDPPDKSTPGQKSLPAKSPPGQKTPGEKGPSGDIFYCSGSRQLNHSSSYFWLEIA